MTLILDHLAVSAKTLTEGRDAVEALLGVRLQPGGNHVHFGTHNLLLGLEDGLYLEVIAIDPEAPAPDHARWFDLNCFDGAPQLSNWICRTNNLNAAAVHFPAAGMPVALARGDLRWEMAVPVDGKLPYDNLFPALIEWQGTEHPAKRLAPSGVRLEQLVVHHPDAGALQNALKPALHDDRIIFETGPARLSAGLMTPQGRRITL